MKFFPGSTNTEKVVLCHFRETLKFFGKVGSAAFDVVVAPANVDQAITDRVRKNFKPLNLFTQGSFKVMNSHPTSIQVMFWAN